MRILQEISFRITKNTAPDLRYPDLRNGEFTFDFQLANKNYYGIIRYNNASNAPYITIYNNFNEIEIHAMRLVNAYGGLFPNYLPTREFLGTYALIYSEKQQRIILYALL